MNVCLIVLRNTVRRTGAVDLRDVTSVPADGYVDIVVWCGRGEIVIQWEYEFGAISLYRDFFTFIVFQEYENPNLCACEYICKNTFSENS
jgi:hypothetical protein